MRISERLIFDTIVSQLQRQTRDYLTIQERVATGKKVNRPSDDPVGQALILGYETDIATTDQYLKNNDHVNSLLVISESAVALMLDQLARAHELAVQMASGTNSAGDRGDAAVEIREIYDQMVSAGNATFGGRYIFAGNEILTPPFVSRGRHIGTAMPAIPLTITAAVNDTLTLNVDGTSSTVTLTAGVYATGAAMAAQIQTDINSHPAFTALGLSVAVAFDSTTNQLTLTSDAVGQNSAITPGGGTSAVALGLVVLTGTNQPSGTYLGDSGKINILIGPGSQIESNLPGDRLLLGTGVSGGINVFTALGGLQTALETNNVAGIQAALTTLGTAQEQIIGERGVLGARMNRIDASSFTLRDFKEALLKLKSQRADVDIAFAASELAVQQLALQVSQAMAARMFDTSLIQFLR